MRQIFFLGLLVLAACGMRPSNVDFGKTTSKELIAEKGEPLEVRKVSEANSEIYQYENNEKFQIKNDVVTQGFFDPKGEEKSLLFWKHKFRDCDTSERMIGKPSGHEQPEYEIRCAKEGVTIIYTQGSEFVSRVIYHEKN